MLREIVLDEKGLGGTFITKVIPQPRSTDPVRLWKPLKLVNQGVRSSSQRKLRVWIAHRHTSGTHGISRWR